MVNTIKALYRYFMWRIFSDEKGIASNIIYKERISICEECEHYFKPTMQCVICKCFMFMKARVLDTNCPIEKWGNPSHQWGRGL
tara:strand:+ start:346 stop:597 length:252 start_codon:yes stop_codon:yes gene_type:complete